MFTATIEALYLGRTEDLDPDESNSNTEGAAKLVGLVVGSAQAPVVDHNLTRLTFTDANNDGTVSDDEALPGDAHGEGISHEGIFQTVDSSNLFAVTLTYTDGSSASTKMVLVQDVGGRVFLMPRMQGSADNAVLNDAPIQSVRLDGVVQSNAKGFLADKEPDAFVTCFLAGTLIETRAGPRPVEALCPGVALRSLDHGLVPLQAVSERRLAPGPTTNPVRFRPGALGRGRPQRDLWLSPQHRVLVRSRIAGRLFGTGEVLVPAVKLVGLPGITRCHQPRRELRYLHLLCAGHEIVSAEGAWCETLFLGVLSRADLGRMPGLTRRLLSGAEMAAARPLAPLRGAQDLAARHARNAQPLLQW